MPRTMESMLTCPAPLGHGDIVQLAHGGACQFEVAVRGRPAHVSRWDEGIDAIRKATDLLARLASQDAVSSLVLPE